MPRSTVHDPWQLRDAGLRASGERAAEQLGRFWIHPDVVDVLDEAAMPATDYLMPGGLDWDELAELLAPLCAAPGLAGISLGCRTRRRTRAARCTERTCGLLADAPPQAQRCSQPRLTAERHVRGVDVVRRARLVVADVDAAGARATHAPTRANSTSMIGSARPCAMNARRPCRSASEGCQPSTVGTKPEKDEQPRRRRPLARQPERVAHHRAHRESAEHGPLRPDARPLPELVVEGGELPVRGPERVRVGVADARHDVPVVARPAGQREGAARRHDVQPPRRIEHVGEPEQVVLVGPAPVVQDEQPGGLTRRPAARGTRGGRRSPPAASHPVELLERLAGAERDALQRRVGDPHRHPGLGLQALVEPAQQRAPAREQDALLRDVRGQLGRRLLQRRVHGGEDVGERPRDRARAPPRRSTGPPAAARTSGRARAPRTRAPPPGASPRRSASLIVSALCEPIAIRCSLRMWFAIASSRS